jgi:hypothetical protein
MDARSYEEELRQGLEEAINRLAEIEKFSLYTFNIWTDLDAGVIEFSADTRDNSERVVRAMQVWQEEMANKLQRMGRPHWANSVSRPYSRNQNPAEFAYKGIVRLEHTAWSSNPVNMQLWDVVEKVLLRLRDRAVATISSRLEIEPDAEVSIGTRHSWYDSPVPIQSPNVDHL